MGSCFCHKVLDSPPRVKLMESIRKKLKGHTPCGSYVRFQVDSWRVCGGSKEPWVIELTSCFDRKECGHAYSGRMVQQEHSPPHSTPIPESTEGAPAVTDIPAQTYLPFTLQSTQQPTLPVPTLSLDTKLIYSPETTASSVGHNLETGPEAGANQKQLEGNVGPTPGIIIASVLSAIFILTGILYVLCKRRRNQPPQYSPGEVEAFHGGPVP